MQTNTPSHVISVGISIAVTTKMSASIISADISTENAAAFRTL